MFIAFRPGESSLSILSTVSVLASIVFAQGAPPDSLNLYGGPGVSEGTFQTEAGQPDPQGWTHSDDTVSSSPVARFESVGTLPASGFGDFAQLWSGLPDLDPDQENASPQWAFLDDGIVVPGVGPTLCLPSEGYPAGTFAVNHDGGMQGTPSFLMSNSLWSPPIPLPDPLSGSLVVSVDAYLHNSPCLPTGAAPELIVGP